SFFDQPRRPPTTTLCPYTTLFRSPRRCVNLLLRNRSEAGAGMRAKLENRRLAWAHWGAYEAIADTPSAPARSLRGLPEDPDPSPIGLEMLEALRSSTRVQRPAVRAGWLAAHRRGEIAGRGAGRGREPFVEVSWDTALDLVAGELERVRSQHGNASIFG